MTRTCLYISQILQDLARNGITLYSHQTYSNDDHDTVNDLNDLHAHMPFAIVASEKQVQIAGKKLVRGRAYPWGTVEGTYQVSPANDHILIANLPSWKQTAFWFRATTAVSNALPNGGDESAYSKSSVWEFPDWTTRKRSIGIAFICWTHPINGA